MQKKIIIVLASIAVIIAAFFAWRFLSGPEDAWLCQNGLWIRHGQPSQPMPATPCARDNAPEPDGTTPILDNLLRLETPQPGETVGSPLRLYGQARGPWYFEGSFPVLLLDDQGKTLATGIAQADGEWMTEAFVPFKATLTFVPTTPSGTLVLKKDNPSGLPENDDARYFPLRFTNVATQSVAVFFGNTIQDPNVMDCGRTFAATRVIPKTISMGKAALTELLKGPTPEEQARGFISSIPPGTVLNSLNIRNEIAYADFDNTLQFQVGGSCRVTAIRSQITNTLKQFVTIRDVVISIDGRTEDILQP